MGYKLWFTLTVKYYLAVGRKEVLVLVMTKMSLKYIS